jgi:hypothetical protein
MRICLLAGLVLVLGCSDGGGNGGFDWPTCERIATGPTLEERAAYFDEVSRTQHLGGDKLYRNIYLTEDLQDVEYLLQTENTILWSGMYLASQAFRYAATKDPEAVENARTVLDGLHDLTLVTGVRGLYGRALWRPDVPFNYDGTGNPGWSDSTSIPDWRFRNDVSKDGYAGLMFGYAAAMEHFDDAGIIADVKERLDEIGDHLYENGLQIIDVDGQVTEHGALYHSAFDDFPGFNAMLAASFIKVAQTANDDSDLDDFYYGCLMQTRSGVNCPDIEITEMGTYIESMEDSLFLFLANCKQNYDNFDMCYQAIYPLLRRERHDGLQARLLGVLRNNMFHTDDPAHQSVALVGNSWYTFAYAALVGDGPDDDPVLKQAVDDAICKLKEFPQEKYDRSIPAGTQQEVCRTRLDEPAAAETIPLGQYHFDNYLWRLDFFKIQEERPEDRRMVYSAEDFLVVYWMGRYHGLISGDL